MTPTRPYLGVPLFESRITTPIFQHCTTRTENRQQNYDNRWTARIRHQKQMRTHMKSNKIIGYQRCYEYTWNNYLKSPFRSLNLWIFLINPIISLSLYIYSIHHGISLRYAKLYKGNTSFPTEPRVGFKRRSVLYLYRREGRKEDLFKSDNTIATQFEFIRTKFLHAIRSAHSRNWNFFFFFLEKRFSPSRYKFGCDQA